MRLASRLRPISCKGLTGTGEGINTQALLTSGPV